MKALILAGGSSKRLKPLTDDIPKCMLLVNGKTIIERQIDILQSFKINDVIVVTGFKSEILTEYLKKTFSGINFVFVHNDEYKDTGPAYGLYLAKEYIGSDDIIYLHGDLVCDKAVITKIIKSKFESTTALNRNTWHPEQTKISINKDHSIKTISKKLDPSNTDGEFVGATKISKKFGLRLKDILADMVKDGNRNSFAVDALNKVVQESSEKIHALDTTKYRSIEIDTAEDLKKANNIWGSGKLHRLLTLIKIITSKMVHVLSFLFIRNKKKWIFVGWHTNSQRELFADNSKYMFLHSANTIKNVRSIWMSKDKILAKILSDKGYESYYLYSLNGIWHSLTSGVLFIDAMLYIDNWQFSGNSKIIQLWHGKGMKKTGHEGNYSLKRYSRTWFPHLFQKYDLLIASSEYTKKLMMQTFQVKENSVIVTGLPRNDTLSKVINGCEIDMDIEYKKGIDGLKKNGVSKIISYMPTFRPDGSNPINQLDFEKFNSFLIEKNWGLIITSHPKFSNKTNTHKDFSNIRLINSGFDIYPLLKEIGLLITDYSSIYVDYLLLNRPIIFFTYDKDRYEIENGLNEDFEKLTPGPHPKNFDELIEILKSEDTFSDERKRVSEIMHKNIDNLSCNRIGDHVVSRFIKNYPLK